MMLASGNDYTANNEQVAKLYISADPYLFDGTKKVETKNTVSEGLNYME
jgi:hypothetical protein